VNVTYFEFDFKNYKETQATLRFNISNPGSKLWYLWLDYDPVYRDAKMAVVLALHLANKLPNDDNDDDRLSGGLIALFVILALIIACLTAAAIILAIKRRRASFTEIP